MITLYVRRYRSYYQTRKLLFGINETTKNT